jgi:hypothetical protein
MKQKVRAYTVDDDSSLYLTKLKKTTQHRLQGAINNNKRRQQLTIALHDLEKSYGRTINKNKNEPSLCRCCSALCVYPTKFRTMETVCFSETLVATFKSTPSYKLEHQHRHLHHHENLR